MAANARILVIDDEEGMCSMIRAVLEDQGFSVDACTDPLRAVENYVPGAYSVLLTDVKMPGMSGLELLDRVRQTDSATPVIMITAHATVETSIQALRRGAYDMLIKPFDPEELLHRVGNALRQHELLSEVKELKGQLAGREAFDRLIGESEDLNRVIDVAARVALRDFPVLINGESGTGKELAAQAIHAMSPRNGGRFVAINCGALPKSLLESELFGARKGAFTGADGEREGLVKAADGGTLFLDEVGTLPADTQKVFLRFLQEKEFYRVGDSHPTKVDVRIVSATNSNLEEAVAKGEFREDLYYRLAVAKITMPPLRKRPGDIPLLAHHFVREQNQKFQTTVKGFSASAMAALVAHPWPGNIRQLRNVIEAAMSVTLSDVIELDAISQFLRLDGLMEEKKDSSLLGAAERDYAASLATFESAYFADLLKRCGGSVEEAAARAGVNLATFYRKMKKYGIRKD